MRTLRVIMAVVVASAAVWAAGARADAFRTTATAPINASITERAGIEIISPLVLPTVTVSAGGAGFAGIAPSSGTGALVGAASNVTPDAVAQGAGGGATSRAATGMGNAALTIHGQAGDTVSTAVPESFQVIRAGGTEAITVNTNSGSEYGIAGSGVTMGGSIMQGNAMSVNIGGAVSFASAISGNIVPGPYEGLLVVVVQYN